MLRLDVRDNIPGAVRWVDDLAKQTAFATSKAINQTANAVRNELRREVGQVFDRPTPYVVNAMRVKRYSTKSDLRAEVGPAYLGGKGVDPESVLHAEVFGGPRRLKRSEVALQRVGILPQGFYIVPGEGAPRDAYGNVPGSFLVQLLSYLQAMGEQGYRANMTDKRKRQLAKVGKSAGGFKTIGGVEYFVAYGNLRGGKTAHLHPGIWSRRGIHGSDVKPVLLFVRSPQYRKRFDMGAIGERTVARVFRPAFDAAFVDALRTARPAGGVR